jgi:MarR family transcriptional regulator, transcriptional regulator for hemolysin
MEAKLDPQIFRIPGHLISRSARLLVRWGEPRFQELGLAIAQVPVLYALRDGASLTQKELASLARIEQPTMAQLLGRMERDGLIRRTANPDDQRSSLISLTKHAQKKLPQAKEILLEGNAEALQGFSDEEIVILCGLLRRVVRNLDPGRICPKWNQSS